jgi:hypothetical protein
MYIENIDHFVDEEKVEDTNEVARSHRSKDKQHNGQMKKDKPLQLTDIVIFWTCLSHFQNGMLSHPLQSIVKLLEIKKISVYDKLILNLLEVSKVEVIPMLQLCNIPFWKWLKQVQNITISVSCNDFDGNQLSSLQQNNFTGCSGEYLCTWFVCPFSFGHCVVCPFSFGHCVVCPFSFGHCVVCPSIYGFWHLSSHSCYKPGDKS